MILITSDVSDAFVLDAFEAGASGYLLKNHDTGQLVEVIRGAVAGEKAISSRMTPRLLQELADRRPADRDVDALARLTPAERRAVAVLASGVTANERIAAALQVSVNTVRSQLAAAMGKLDLDDRTQLALWGIRNGLGRPGS